MRYLLDIGYERIQSKSDNVTLQFPHEKFAKLWNDSENAAGHTGVFSNVKIAMPRNASDKSERTILRTRRPTCSNWQEILCAKGLIKRLGTFPSAHSES